MRNLKRALSLALAAVMLLGMMVVGTSAVSVDGFTDADEITNLEAASVTTAIGIFAGYDDGSFGADDYVTRAQMATIICKILNGSNVNADIFKGVGKFQDLGDAAWAEGFINMCYSMGIIAGTSDTTFDPNRPVKTWEASLMLQRALGWWAANDPANSTIGELTVTTKGTALNMYGELTLLPTEYLTRNDVAEMVYHTIVDCVPVAYNESFGLYRNTSSTTLFSGVVYDYRDSLAYTTFGLVYEDGEDVFGRVSTVWGIGTVSSTGEDGYLTGCSMKTELTTVPKAPVLTYTSSVTGRTLYNDLGLTATESGVELYVDGKLDTPVNITKTGGALAVTGNGVLTEVFQKSDDTYRIVVTNTYVMEVDGVYEAKRGSEAYVTVNTLDYGPANYPYISTKFDNSFETEAFARGDVVLITVAFDRDAEEAVPASGKYHIQSMERADAVEGTLTRYSITNGTATVGGVTYDFAEKTNRYAHDYVNDGGNGLKSDVVVYLDNYGYAVEIRDISEIESVSDYALVIAVDTDNSSVFESNNAWVKMLLTDGSIVTGKFTWTADAIDPTKADTGSGEFGYGDLILCSGATQDTKLTLYTGIRQLVTYETNNDGLYVLSDPSETTVDGLKTQNNKSIVQDYYSAAYRTTGYLNNASVLIVDKSTPSKPDQFDVYVGVAAVPDIESSTATTKYVGNGVITDLIDIIYTTAAPTAGGDTSSDLIYIVDVDGYNNWVNDQDEGAYVLVTAIVNGEITELKIQGKLSAGIVTINNAGGNNLGSIANGEVFTKMVTDKNGIVTKVESDSSEYKTADGIIRANKDVIGVGIVNSSDKYYTWADDVVVAYVDLDLNISNPRITSLATDTNAKVIYGVNPDRGTEIMWIYVIEKNAPPARQTHVVDLSGMTGGNEFSIEGVYFQYAAGRAYTPDGEIITGGTGTQRDPYIIASGKEASAVATKVAAALAAVTEIDDAYYVVAVGDTIKFVERTPGNSAPTVSGVTVSSADSTQAEVDAEAANRPGSETPSGNTIALIVDVTDLKTGDTLPDVDVSATDADGNEINTVTASITWTFNSASASNTNSRGVYTGTITVTGATELEDVTYTVNGTEKTDAAALTVTVKVYEEIDTVDITVTGNTTISLAAQTTADLPTVANGSTDGVTSVSVSWTVVPNGETDDEDVEDGDSLVKGEYTGTVTATADASDYYKLAENVTYNDSSSIATSAGAITVTVGD